MVLKSVEQDFLLLESKTELADGAPFVAQYLIGGAEYLLMV